MPDQVQRAAREYLAAGFQLVEIPAGSKGPTYRGWNTASGGITDPARIAGGIGLAHAYSRTAALDFDDLAAATTWLAERGVDVPALWGSFDAVRISSGRANRGKLLYRLPDGVKPLPSKKITQGKATLFEFRCGTANGLTVQDVLPPTIHADTGQPYRWEYGDDLAGHWSALPTLPAPVLALWQVLVERPTTDNTPQDKARLGLTEGQIRGALRHIEPDCSYDEWLRAGMAVHHESGGQPYGLALFDEWSAQGSKYPGADAIAAKWDSFGRDRQSVVTGRHLLSVANVATPDDFEDVPASLLGDPPRFEFEPAETFAARPLPEWLVKDVLPQAGLAVVYGASGDGKTFFVLDLVAAIARGIAWRERRTKQGRVAYLVAEGAAGFRKRLRAYREHHGAPLTDVYVHGGAPNLLIAKDVTDLATALQALGPLAVVVVDTAAQVMPGGNENASEDMGKLVAAARKIHEATGALVLFVHHSGKDASKGARGWSGLRAACDAEIEITRAEDGTRCASLSKQKDAADGDRLGFKLSIVDLGTDADGDPITSCAVEPCDAPVQRVPGRPGSTDGKTQATVAFESIRAALLLTDGGQLTRVEASAIVAAAEPFASFDGKHRAGRVSRAIDEAIAKGWLLGAAGMLSAG